MAAMARVRDVVEARAPARDEARRRRARPAATSGRKLSFRPSAGSDGLGAPSSGVPSSSAMRRLEPRQMHVLAIDHVLIRVVGVVLRDLPRHGDVALAQRRACRGGTPGGWREGLSVSRVLLLLAADADARPGNRLEPGAARSARRSRGRCRTCPSPCARAPPRSPAGSWRRSASASAGCGLRCCRWPDRPGRPGGC